MKSLQRSDLFAWSVFEESKDIDFNGHLLVRPDGPNIAFDPMPLCAHDAAQIDCMGGIDLVMISTADHVRATADVVARWGAAVAAPALESERAEFATIVGTQWLEPDEVVEDVRCLWMRGSKAPGELAFLLPGGDTLITGDLVRAQRAGSLSLLPDEKLSDRAAAFDSVALLAALPDLQAVLVGDGQSVFRDAPARLAELVQRLL